MCSNGIVITVYKEFILLYYIRKAVFPMSLKLMMPVTEGIRHLSSTAENRKVVCGLL
jgi:hypothetical protein